MKDSTIAVIRSLGATIAYYEEYTASLENDVEEANEAAQHSDQRAFELEEALDGHIAEKETMLIRIAALTKELEHSYDEQDKLIAAATSLADAVEVGLELDDEEVPSPYVVNFVHI